MDDVVNDFNNLKSLIFLFFALIAWSIRLEYVVKSNAKSAIDHTKELKMLFHKSDNLEAELKILKGKFEIVGSMMSPDNQKAHWTLMEGFKKDIEHLQKEISRCLSG
jgi:hypothetical protein